MDAVAIARVCHEANRAYALSLGDETVNRWDTAQQWQRDAAIEGVQYRIANPYASPAAQHEEWVKNREARGWTLGPVKDDVEKTHPCLVPYDQLPAEQKVKDSLFAAIVQALIQVPNVPRFDAPTLGKSGFGLIETPQQFEAVLKTGTAEIPLVKREEAPEIPDYRAHGKGKKGR